MKIIHIYCPSLMLACISMCFSFLSFISYYVLRPFLERYSQFKCNSNTLLFKVKLYNILKGEGKQFFLSAHKENGAERIYILFSRFSLEYLSIYGYIWFGVSSPSEIRRLICASSQIKWTVMRQWCFLLLAENVIQPR